MDLFDIYLEIAPADIAYVKFIFESYEEVGLVRTVDRERAVIVLLAMSDFLDVARQILASLQNDIALREIPRPPAVEDDWFMVEMSAAFNPDK